MKWFLVLVLYAACADPEIRRVGGPYETEAICEEYMEKRTRHFGPPGPGQILDCRLLKPTADELRQWDEKRYGR